MLSADSEYGNFSIRHSNIERALSSAGVTGRALKEMSVFSGDPSITKPLGGSLGVTGESTTIDLLWVLVAAKSRTHSTDNPHDPAHWATTSPTSPKKKNN